MTAIEDWWGAGHLARIDLGGEQRSVFTGRMGSGPRLTLLHGYPSSSHDWAKVAPALATHHALLFCDFLGFGMSDKPAEHVYSIHEQADLVEALWLREGTTATALVAHDYGVSVAQELLARRGEGQLSVEITGATFLNGGLYPGLHRPQPIQEALLDPEQGPQISAGLTEELFVQALAPTFADGFDHEPHAREMWRGITRNGGRAIFHKLIRYILDRREHAERWTGALERTDVPVAFVWGLLDPVSGAHMAERIRERLPDAPMAAMDDVSHWPPLEAPERVVAALLRD